LTPRPLQHLEPTKQTNKPKQGQVGGRPLGTAMGPGGGDGPRPMTSNKGAGYSSTPKVGLYKLNAVDP
jgi:hypothetical protein